MELGNLKVTKQRRQSITIIRNDEKYQYLPTKTNMTTISPTNGTSNRLCNYRTYNPSTKQTRTESTPSLIQRPTAIYDRIDLKPFCNFMQNLSSAVLHNIWIQYAPYDKNQTDDAIDIINLPSLIHECVVMYHLSFKQGSTKPPSILSLCVVKQI